MIHIKKLYFQQVSSSWIKLWRVRKEKVLEKGIIASFWGLNLLEDQRERKSSTPKQANKTLTRQTQAFSLTYWVNEHTLIHLNSTEVAKQKRDTPKEKGRAHGIISILYIRVGGSYRGQKPFRRMLLNLQLDLHPIRKAALFTCF